MSYGVILTTAGAAKIAAGNVNITEMAIGDSGGTEYEPNGSEVELLNEVYRGNVSAYSVSENKIFMQLTIPRNTGGFYIREAGAYDEDGVLIFIANIPPRLKTTIAEGATSDLTINMVATLSNDADVSITIDGSSYVTVGYLDGKTADNEETSAATSATKLTTPAGVYAAYGVNDPVTKSTNSTLTVDDHIVLVDTPSVQITLPDIADYPKSRLNKLLLKLIDISGGKWSAVTSGFTPAATVNLSITGGSTTPPTYALNSSNLTVTNATITGNVATATADGATAQTVDYVATGNVSNIIAKMQYKPLALPIASGSSTGSIKVNYSENNTLQVGSKILVTKNGATTEETIAAGSQTTIAAPTIAASTIERAILKLANGKLLITGGGVANTYAYDPVTGTLETLANNPEGSSSWYYNSCAAVGNKAYFWGNQSRSNTLRIYDYDTNSWSVGATYFTGLSFATCLALTDGRIMIIGGQINLAIDTDVCRIYNPSTNTYSTIANLPAISDSGVAVQIDSDTVIMIRGRRDGNTGTNDFYRYKISTDTWTNLENLPVSKTPGQFLYLINSNIIRYATSNTANGNDYYDYNISGNSWSSATVLTTPTNGYIFGVVQGNNGIWYTINLDAKIRTINFTTNTVAELPSYYQFTITSPALPVPDAVYLGGQSLQYYVGTGSTPTWTNATVSYSDAAGLITATAGIAATTGTHVQLKATLKKGDILSQIGATLTIAGAGSGGTEYRMTPYAQLTLRPTADGWLIDSDTRISINTKSTNYTLLVGDDIIIAGADNITLTLADATKVQPGKVRRIKSQSHNNITINAKSGQSINGASSLILNAGDSLVYYSDSSNWIRD